MDHIRWQMFELDELPEALFGYYQFRSIDNSYLYRNCLNEQNIAIGFSRHVHETMFNPPVIIIVGDGNSAEILSWLKVYAPITFPLSQFTRVLSIKDWDIFHENAMSKNLMIQHEDIWASLILGEMLAQGENDIELNFLPLSRAAACFTTAMARVSIVHGHNSAIRTCIDRLTILESDRRFVRRSVVISDLLPIWSIISLGMNEPRDVYTAVEFVLEAVRKHVSKSKSGSMSSLLRSLNRYPDLLSDSIEVRTIAFKVLADEFKIEIENTPSTSYSCALLAAGAFLVGRGTTHAFLLNKFAKQNPVVFVWFGLIAALSGPHAWDVSWSRATKGVERLLRTKFDWTDPHTVDICWAEYHWMAKMFEGTDSFNEIPKMLPKVLSIEVVPGVACQLRLSLEQGGASYETEQRYSAEHVKRNEELQAALMQFVTLSMKTIKLLDNQREKTLPKQQSLGLRGIERIATRKPRLKYSK